MNHEDLIVVHHVGKVIAVVPDQAAADEIADLYASTYDLGKIPVISKQSVQLYGRTMFELGWDAHETKRTCV